MAPDLILALDQGSSSTRCIAYDSRLEQRGAASRSITTLRPSPGMVEHDAREVLESAFAVIADVVSGAGSHVAAVGIASQTESFVLWERDSGRTIGSIVSWQDQRADGLCSAIARRPGAEAAVRDTTGLMLDPTFSAPKLAWLFDADPDLRARAASGELLFGDVACWLAWHLSEGATHVTEPANACRSLLVDLQSLRWDDELLRLFGVPAALLPEIRPSDDGGAVATAHGLGFVAPIAAMLGDQPAALLGQGCMAPRRAALTLGTGAFLWLNVGEARPEPPPGVLASAAWERRASGATYALEAFSPNAGNALDLLAALGLEGARTGAAPDWARPRPVVVPAPSGLGSPRWHAADRITVLDASSSTTLDDLAAATLVGIAHQIADAVEAVDARASADVVRVGGGLAAHEGLVQAVADLCGLPLEISAEREATARGVALLAAEAVGVMAADVVIPATVRTVTPRLDDVGRARERARWEHAVDVHMAADT